MTPHEETERLPQISLRPEHDGRKEVDVFFSSFFLSDFAADSLWSGRREGNGRSGECERVPRQPARKLFLAGSDPQGAKEEKRPR